MNTLSVTAKCAEAGSQTEQREACGGARCAAVGACARVRRGAADADGAHEVLIVLLPHHHALPAAAPAGDDY